MNRRDRAIVAALVLVLVALGGVLGLPKAGTGAPIASSEPIPTQTIPPIAAWREGVVGVPVSVTPVTARSRSERTLVGLIYSGLVKLGTDSSYSPDLSDRWTSDDKGRVWTFHIRDGAVWQDGEPVTAADVVYTVQALQSTDAAGAAAASWADVTVQAADPRTVVFTLGAPIGSFLAAATQPLLPAHLLTDVPFADLATSDFAHRPVGSGPYAVSEMDGKRAVLVPTSTVLPGIEDPVGQESPSSSLDSLATPWPVASAAVPTPYLGRIEVHFYPDEAALATAMRAGAIDGAAGLSKETLGTLAALPGVNRLRYPTTTLSAVLLNLRPNHPELRDPRVRRALLAAIDRDALVSDVLVGDALKADALVPPGSWAFDAASAGAVPFDQKAAQKLLDEAGWTRRKGGKLVAPKGTQPYTLELITVPAGANPRVAAEAAFVRAAWTRLGLTVGLLEVPVTELGTRLREGDFTAAVLDIAQGLEPDLYPLLASSQIRGGGSNLSGYQDGALDTLLEAARAPGAPEERQAAWKALLVGLAARQPILPLAWNDEVALAKGLAGPESRLIAHPGDRFWDVLAWRLVASR